jgi:BirA family biotin operon repressor/biotin-[acetyl-CoA-carboxylase] ligase
VEAETGLRTVVKHPNDVLIGGRKVAGILAEAVEGRVVLGIGVNVSQTKAQLPENVETPATSLSLEGATVDPAELLAAILEQLEAHYDHWVTSSSDT